jgi:MFS family permease
MSTTTDSLPPTAGRRRRTLPPGVALAGAAITFTSLYLAAGALTPLLVVYRDEWAFSPSLLTVAFAAYAVGFLAAVLTLGSLSDRIGRRPALLGALAIQLVANVVFLTAHGIGGVTAGRIVQGVAGGAATTAFTAMLVELAPAHRKRLGATLGSVGVTGGLALGSLLAGVAIQFSAAASSIAFVVLIVATVFGIAVIAAAPETVPRAPGAVRAMVPRIAVPPVARTEFVAAAPAVAAVWMLAGLSGGLAPSLVRTVFHLDSGLLNGFTGFIAPATSAVVALALARLHPRQAMTIGIYASIFGPVLIVIGVLVGSLATMIVGQALAGAGFGAAFTAALRLILPLASANQRAGIVGGIYLVSYLAFGVPIVIAGALTGALGAVPTVVAYSAVTVGLALVSLGAQLRIKHHDRRPPDGIPTAPAPALADA